MATRDEVWQRITVLRDEIATLEPKHRDLCQRAYEVDDEARFARQTNVCCLRDKGHDGPCRFC